MINNKISLEEINLSNKNTLMESLGIEITKIGSDYINAKMPVDHRTKQQVGLLNGGASAALIESICSLASALCIDLNKKALVGLEINANHLKGVKSGYVYAFGKLIHEGRTIHLWNVDIMNENEDLVCTGKLTAMVIDKK